MNTLISLHVIVHSLLTGPNWHDHRLETVILFWKQTTHLVCSVCPDSQFEMNSGDCSLPLKILSFRGDIRDRIKCTLKLMDVIQLDHFYLLFSYKYSVPQESSIFDILNTLREHQTDLSFTRVSQVSDWCFTMVVNEKIYLEAYINKEYICLKNNLLHNYILYQGQPTYTEIFPLYLRKIRRFFSTGSGS